MSESRLDVAGELRAVAESVGMVGVTFSGGADGLLSVLVDGARWRETVEENRPYLAPGCVVKVVSADGRRIYREVIRS